MFVYNGYQSADAVAVMFEHGGNPSLKIEDVSLIRNLNLELLFFCTMRTIVIFRIQLCIIGWYLLAMGLNLNKVRRALIQ